MAENEPLNEPRAKRTKTDRHGRSAAFEKLKQLKGNKSKYKYEVAEMVDNVYEEVDEKEYTKKVLERQDDDWIVDDDGCGYVEDGRDIFDDDLDDESIVKASRQSKKDGKRGLSGKKSSSRLSAEATGSGGIRSMLMKMPAKKRTSAEVKLEDDDVLGDIMQELHNEITSPAACAKPRPLSPRSYMRTLANSSRLRTPTPKSVAQLTPKPAKRDIASAWLDQVDVDDVEIVDTQSQADTSSTSLVPVDISSQTIEQFDSDDEIQNGGADTTMEMPEDLDLLDIPDDATLNRLHAEQIKKEPVSPVQVKKEPMSPALVKPKVEVSTAGELAGVDTRALFSDWSAGGDAAPAFVTVQAGALPLVKNAAGDEVLRFYWLDAFEEPFKQPGVVYLFGKTWLESAKAFVSICITVSNVQRRVFLLPRDKKLDSVTGLPGGEDVTLADVYQEFNEEVSAREKITTFKSRCVEKSYAFGVAGVPVRSEYLEVRYPSSCARLALDASGKTFSHVFGTTSNALELLLLETKMKGPCWMDVKAPRAVTNPSSWCKLQADCTEPRNLSVTPHPQDPPPPLVVASISVRSVVHPTKHTAEVVGIACLTHDAFPLNKAAPAPLFQQHFCAFTRPSDVSWPYDVGKAAGPFARQRAEKCESERALLSFFLVKLQRLDPDLIVGHDLVGYSWDLLVNKCNEHKVPNMSRLGRLKRSYTSSDYDRKKQLKESATGRLICDVKISAKELIKSRTYDLETLAKDVLKVDESACREMSVSDVRAAYATLPGLLSLLDCTRRDALLALSLMAEMNALPLAAQITNVAGYVLARTLMGGRAERNEFLLLHAFTERGYIVPDKRQEDKAKAKGPVSRNKKPAYAGGLVLEPKKGLYDQFVLLMDFNSLYPSIIQEYNICFTTMPSGTQTEPSANAPPGVLPTEIRKLVESRRDVKRLMAGSDVSAEQRLQYNIRQLALKLTANSMYGCLGFSHSRFFAQDLAALVTSKGREILMNTKDLVEKLNFEVIYGDTDSLMINTKCTEYEQVFKIGHKIKTEVNKLYRQVELEVDGVFRYLLLLKKKKYAAVSISRLPGGQLADTLEYKGLDIVRRDWSQLSAQAGQFIVGKMLTELSGDERVELIHSHLATLREDLEAGRVPLELLAITKALTKPPRDYADARSLPHVQVALRINASEPNKLRQGDTVAYLICLDDTENAATQRAYHIDEVKANPALRVDVGYYLANQIHPVISRLCDPLEGTDAARIADVLGLDSSKYRHKTVSAPAEARDNDVGAALRLDPTERFRDCERLRFRCVGCGADNEITPPTGTGFALERCSGAGCSLMPIDCLAAVQNTLSEAMRRHISVYYQKWLICEDPACDYRTRRLPLKFYKNYPVCGGCNVCVMYREYSSGDLYKQLSYYKYLFDVAKCTPRPSEKTEMGYTKLSDLVAGMLRVSAYSFIDLGSMFSQVAPAVKRPTGESDQVAT